MFILTVDYEVFGNGSGCLDSCVIQPVKRMQVVANKYNAPITFFVEALEFELMQKAQVDCIESVIKQLKELFYSGHDIQLHIHPQWYCAQWNGSNWRLSEKKGRIGDLDDDLVYSILQQGKEWLKSILTSDFKDYNCIAFRAGGWCIQPSHHIISALIKLGFQVDSTVAPGLQNFARNKWFHFKNTPNKPFWRVRGDVCKEEYSSLWEVPIVTGKISKLKHLQSVQRARNFGSNGMAKGCIGSYQGVNGWFQTICEKLGKLKNSGSVMLDISTMPINVLIDITEQWLTSFSDNKKPIPLVAIAHTKNFTEASEQNLSDFLKWLKRAGIKFSTYEQWLKIFR